MSFLKGCEGVFKYGNEPETRMNVKRGCNVMKALSLNDTTTGLPF